MTDDDTVTELDWFKGIFLSIVASLIGSASKLAIRKSWLIEAFDNEDETVTSRHFGQDQTTLQSADDDDITTIGLIKGLRISGMIGLTILNPLCGILAMNYASPSILAPFSGLTLVWIILCSEYLIGEKPSETQILAACLIVLGEAIVAIFGDHTNERFTVDEVRHSYKSTQFIIYFVFIALWLSLLVYWIRYSKSPTLVRLSWGLGGGTLAGLQNFIKDALTIMKAVQDENKKSGESSKISDYPAIMWVMAFLALFVAISGITILSICMKKYDATYSASMFIGSFVMSASIVSAIHYNTFANLEHAWNYIFYPVGLVVLMMGVDLLLLDSAEGGSTVSIGSSESDTNLETEPNLPTSLQEPLLDDERHENNVI